MLTYQLISNIDGYLTYEFYPNGDKSKYGVIEFAPNGDWKLIKRPDDNTFCYIAHATRINTKKESGTVAWF